MSPDEAEGLPDTMWDAMVRHIRLEAEAIQRASKPTGR
jgi:hypothetical protein